MAKYSKETTGEVSVSEKQTMGWNDRTDLPISISHGKVPFNTSAFNIKTTGKNCLRTEG